MSNADDDLRRAAEDFELPSQEPSEDEYSHSATFELDNDEERGPELEFNDSDIEVELASDAPDELDLTEPYGNRGLDVGDIEFFN